MTTSSLSYERSRRTISFEFSRWKNGAVALTGILLLSGCEKQNAFVPPPPPEVEVALPIKQTVSLHFEQTGMTEAFAAVDLVARVEGFLTDINYRDGEVAKKGQSLFIIQQSTYKNQLQQAEAALAAAKAELFKSQMEFDRQSTLLKQNVTTQAAYDLAQAQRDTNNSQVMSAQAGVDNAKLNLDYTTVTAPFDGIVTRHLVSIGELVGGTTTTKLASIVQLDPIYVTFNVSEQQLLKVRQNLGQRLSLDELHKFPIEVGLMNEQGYPHKGTLNYVSPELDQRTGTVLMRGILSNPDRALDPGFFVRIQVPTGRIEQDALLVPDRALGLNQDGRYLLLVNGENVVEQRKVQVGEQFADLRIIERGLKPEDRVVVGGIQRAIPGKKVDPHTTVISGVASN
jgi:RND family efflux transporter MFP subunit